MIPLTEIYCFIDDFCKSFECTLKKRTMTSKKTRIRRCILSISEIMTILVMFQLSHYKTLKDFYLNELIRNYRSYSLKFISYNYL